MAITANSIAVLRDSIRDGSFPDDNDLLTNNVSLEAIPSLLAAVSEGRGQLKNEIRDVSNGQAGDVDEWIAQAKKVQEDIAKCKIEARKIVEEHDRVESMRRTVRGASNKVQLLEAEIAFTRSLEYEMQNIAEISQVLDEVGNHLLQKDPITSVEKLGSIKNAVNSVSAGHPRKLLLQLEHELHQKSRSQLQDSLDARWILTRSESEVSLQFLEDVPDTERAEAAVELSFSRILNALTELDALPDATALLSRKFETFILPLLSSKTVKRPSSVDLEEHKLKVELSSHNSDVRLTTDIVRSFVMFINSHVPQLIRDDLARNLLPKVVSSLISNLLNDAVPQELDEMPSLEDLQEELRRLATLLSQYSWPGYEELRAWISNIPQTWLVQRQTRSLDIVRKSFAGARGTTRQVERVERQILSKQEAARVTGQEVEDDWNAAWDDENPAAQSHSSTIDKEEDSSAWDLEIEDDTPGMTDKHDSVDEDTDEADAWGWGDDTQKEHKDDTQLGESRKVNGRLAPASAEQEMTLTETYTITDLPDHILEVIGKDMHDIHLLETNAKAYFKAASPKIGLQSTPALVLAMFRATAPTHYSHSVNLTNMHLYNDVLYIVQKLQENEDLSKRPSVSSGIDAMSKFARQTYTRELDIQRTILSDLLDGAQGFESCTEQPYNRECKNAIDGVIERIRQVHKEWEDILGRNHLMQSIGSLVAMIMQKIVRDIEDMEDITEAQGQQLVEFCHSISSLDSLFVAKMPAATGTRESTTSSIGDSVSTIALYVPNYFRFQYLTQILESNLVEINYLWKEGELHLEFSADEVVDLIKALFSESHKRREAIYEIKRLEAERQS